MPRDLPRPASPPAAWECDNCGATAQPPTAGRPPAGWEPYRAGDYAGPWWCATCIDSLLTQLQAAIQSVRHAS